MAALAVAAAGMCDAAAASGDVRALRDAAAELRELLGQLPIADPVPVPASTDPAGRVAGEPPLDEWQAAVSAGPR